MRGEDVRERAVTFSEAEVKATLEGRKTQVRLSLKPQPRPTKAIDSDIIFGWNWCVSGKRSIYLYEETLKELMDRIARDYPILRPGDHLLVRETWGWQEYKKHDPSAATGFGKDDARIVYRAGGRDGYGEPDGGWQSPATMPKFFSRLILEIVSVRIQRVQEITTAEAVAEGHEDFFSGSYFPDYLSLPAAVANFRRARDATRGRKPGLAWADNPWVRAIEFRVLS